MPWRPHRNIHPHKNALCLFLSLFEACKFTFYHLFCWSLNKSSTTYLPHWSLWYTGMLACIQMLSLLLKSANLRFCHLFCLSFSKSSSHNLPQWSQWHVIPHAVCWPQERGEGSTQWSLSLSTCKYTVCREKSIWPPPPTKLQVTVVHYNNFYATRDRGSISAILLQNIPQ